MTGPVGDPVVDGVTVAVSVTGVPYIAEGAETVTANVVDAAATVICALALAIGAIDVALLVAEISFVPVDKKPPGTDTEHTPEEFVMQV